MKATKRSKNKHPVKLLEDESQKLKEKLQLLRQQVQTKKQEKGLSQQPQRPDSHSGMNRFLKANKSPLYSTQYKQQLDQQLISLCTQLKIESIQKLLVEKGILSYDSFMDVDQHIWDQWKQIPVGFRIKIKKYIRVARENTQCYNEGNEEENKKGSTSATESSDRRGKDIEEIIKCRKQQKQFVPINRKWDEEDSGFTVQDLNEDQQETMIQSLRNVFQTRKKGILKGKKTNNKKKVVHWSESVEELETIHQEKKQKIYPKQLSPKSVQYQQFVKEQAMKKYCWNCLKPILLEGHQHQGKTFCKEQCTQQYQAALGVLPEGGQNGTVQGCEQTEAQEYEQVEMIDLSLV